MNRFELKESDYDWFAKLNDKFWRKDYSSRLSHSGHITLKEWQGLFALIEIYELPCVMRSDPLTFEIHDHQPFINVNDEPLLKLTPYHFRDIYTGSGGYKWDGERTLLAKLTKDIVERDRNLELLKFYDIAPPEDRIFWRMMD